VKPFSNKLTLAQAERLYLLIEEAGEVIQAATKVLRHGYESRDPTSRTSAPNRMALGKELGDLHYARRLLVAAGDIPRGAIYAGVAVKALSVAAWTHHQPIRLLTNLANDIVAETPARVRPSKHNPRRLR
jgi:hypothetical protein